MARLYARWSPRWSFLPLSGKQVQSSSFNYWQRHSKCIFVASWAPIHRAAKIIQGVPTNKQWLLCSHCWYFSCSPACAPASAPPLAGEPFNQLLKAQFWLTQSLKSNTSSARTTLIPLEPVILTECLPTWFHKKSSAPNRLNIRRGPLFLKISSALHHGLK